MAREWILFFYLGMGAFFDGKYHKVSWKYLLVGILLAGYFFWRDMVNSLIFPEQVALRIAPGMLFLIYSRCTGEKIGYGDGMMMMILGGFLTYPGLWWVGGVGMLLFVMTAGILYLGRRIQKNTKLPFFPFLWVGYLAVWGFVYGSGI